MRIISKHKDYYDGAMAYGLDRSIVYVRNTEEIQQKNTREDYQTLNTFYVGFCGKVYPGVFRWVKYDEWKYKKLCFYSLEKTEDYIKTTPDLNKSNKNWWNSRYNKHSFNKHFNEIPNGYNKLFVEHNAPCFIIDHYGHKTIINPILKDWEFYRVFDPFSTYLEISSYVGGVLLSETKPIPEIDDETMLLAKGFNKWSFRKEPSK